MKNKQVGRFQAYKGWLVTIAGTCALLVLGVPNAWSVIKANIPNEWVWSEFQKSLPFSFACVSFSIMTLVGARLLNRFGPRIIVGVGGILAGTGIIISSQSPSPWVFTIGFGILLGTGIGFVYASVTPTALKWFPASKTGLISGIVMAGFGMGSAWVAPLARMLIDSIGLQSTMLYLGIGILIVVVAFAQHMQYPPIDYIPAGSTPEKTVSAVEEIDFFPGETIKTWQFYLIWIAFAFGSGAGLMVIGNLAPIVKDQIGLPAVSALAVSVLSIGNGSGRIFYGILSDKIGRKAVLLISFIFQAALVFVLSFMVKGSSLANVPVLMVLVALMGVNYGANFTAFPAITKDFFGLKNFAMNYGIVFTAWGLGGFMLSQLAGSIKDTTGNFNNAYWLATVLLVMAAILMAVMKAPQKKKVPVCLKSWIK